MFKLQQFYFNFKIIKQGEFWWDNLTKWQESVSSETINLLQTIHHDSSSIKLLNSLFIIST